MGVRPGYKQTEAGVIPDNWSRKEVRELGAVVTGGTPSTRRAEYWNGAYPWITPTDIASRRDLYESERMISDAGLRAVRALPPNTVLVTCIASIGKNAILRTLGASNQQINAVIPDESNDVDFLFYMFEAAKNYLVASAGTTATSMVSKAAFQKLKFGIPPLQEQRAIAEALSDVDALLSGLDRLVAKKRDLKQATMQQLLTGQTRLPGFHGEWEKTRLKQVAEISAGINKPLGEMGSGTLYVTVQDLYDGTSIRTERLSRIRVSPSEMEGRSLSVGDIVFGKSSVKREGIGYPSRFVGAIEPVVFSGFTYRARARTRVADALFLFYGLRAEKSRRWVIDNAQASALTNINQAIADAIPVMLPPSVDEQAAIAQVLSDMDAELAALEARREKTRQLKQGMMQELLTGRTRLV
ncbi:restriction endonuclease subunit S [Polycyclovorans algicola]|uniref:restriction endonuclease subunit S n=1 Tax=Polycyclovorans algicola TaxID=616992 RepID=UPI000A073F2F|nr:restriction endonuclease subunit S [Polycyclovorans algicola]